MHSTFFKLSDVQRILADRSAAFIRELPDESPNPLAYRDVYGNYGFCIEGTHWTLPALAMNPSLGLGSTPFMSMDAISPLRNFWRKLRPDEYQLTDNKCRRIFARPTIARDLNSQQRHFFSLAEMLNHLEQVGRGFFMGHVYGSNQIPIIGIGSDGQWHYGDLKLNHNSQTARLNYHPQRPSLQFWIRDENDRVIPSWTLLDDHTIPTTVLFGNNSVMKLDNRSFR